MGLGRDAFMMELDRVSFGSPGYMNGNNITRAQTGTGSESGAWIFNGNKGHDVAYYEGIYYDPTFGLTGVELESNVYADLFRLRDQHGAPITYTYNGIPYSDTYRIVQKADRSLDIFIAATIPAPTGDGSRWTGFNYVYRPAPQVTSLSIGGTKSIGMPYASLSAGSPGSYSPIMTPSGTGVTWVAASNDSWITIDSANYNASQTDDFETLDITIAPNPSDILRVGSITVNTSDGDDIIYIQQDGAVAFVEASQNTVPAAISGGEYPLDITSNVSWNVFYSAEWIRVPFASGTGKDEVNIVVDANTESTARVAAVWIEGGGASKIITVTQAPYSNSPDASLNGLTVSAGTMMPSFSAIETYYTVTVPYAVESVVLAATPSQYGATVIGTGIKNLAVGGNSFIVTVTAPDGFTTANYTVAVSREQEETTTFLLGFEEEVYETNNIMTDFTVCANVIDGNGQAVNTTVQYTLINYDGEEYSNLTGLFGIECVDNAWGGVVEAEIYYNGMLLTAQAEINYSIINPTFMPVKPTLGINEETDQKKIKPEVSDDFTESNVFE